MNDIFIRSRGMQDSLPRACQQICAYLLENPSQVLHLSVHELAQCSQTSDATVIRLCRLLGFEGYRALLISLSSALTSAQEQQDGGRFTDIGQDMPVPSIISSISRANHQSIDDTLKVLEPARVEAAVKKLEQARQILFCGIGASGLVCMDAEQKLLRVGKSCRACTDGHSQLTAAALLGREDAAVLVSNSGETNDILETLRVLKSNGVCTISLTRYGKNTLAENSHIALYISTPEILFRSGAMGSRIAMLNVVDILYAALVSRSYQLSQSKLLLTREAIERKRRHHQGFTLDPNHEEG